MAAPQTPRRWFDRAVVILFIIVIGLCGAVVLKRDLVRAYWWANALAQANTRDERISYVTRLAGIGGAAVPAVRRLLSDPRPDVRSLAVSILAHANSAAGFDVLVTALSDIDVEVRDDASHALAFGYGADVVRRLSTEIVNSRGDEALAQCVAIGRAENDAAVDALLVVARSHVDTDVRGQAIEMLGIRRATEAMPMLRQLSTDTSPIMSELYGDRRAEHAMEFAGADSGVVAARNSPRNATIGAVAQAAMRLIAAQPASESVTSTSEAASQVGDDR